MRVREISPDNVFLYHKEVSYILLTIFKRKNEKSYMIL